MCLHLSYIALTGLHCIYRTLGDCSLTFRTFYMTFNDLVMACCNILSKNNQNLFSQMVVSMMMFFFPYWVQFEKKRFDYSWPLKYNVTYTWPQDVRCFGLTLFCHCRLEKIRHTYFEIGKMPWNVDHNNHLSEFQFNG